MRINLGFLILPLLVISAACGGDDDDPALTLDQARDLCDRGCQHQLACGDAPTLEACMSECVGEVDDVDWLRAAAFEAITSCIASAPCGGDYDVCLGACRPAAAHEAFEAQCREVMPPCFETAEQLDRLCETTPNDTSDGFDLGYLCLPTSAIMDELTACIPDGTACPDAIACLSAAFERHDIPL
jgi:hypothetical protein